MGVDLEDMDWSRVDKVKFTIYGGTITLVMDVLLYPLEVLKTRMMVDTKSEASVISSFVSTLRSTLRTEGVRGLFRGFLLSTAGGLPSQGAYFAGYAWSKDRLVAAGVPSSVAPLAAGFFADAIAAPLWMPMDVISARLQIQGPGVVAYSSAWDAASSIVRTEGIGGLFRGMGAQVLAFGPASALWWATYEGVNTLLMQRAAAIASLSAAAAAASGLQGPAHVGAAAGLGQPDPAADASQGASASASPLWMHAVSGLVAGLATSIVTNPIEVAKTRLQTQHSLLSEFDAQATEKADRGRSERLEREQAARAQRKQAFFRVMNSGGSGGSSHHRAAPLQTPAAVVVRVKPPERSALRRGAPLVEQPLTYGRRNRSAPTSFSDEAALRGCSAEGVALRGPAASQEGSHPSQPQRYRYPVIKIARPAAAPTPAQPSGAHSAGQRPSASSVASAAPPPPIRGFVALPFPVAPASLPPSGAELAGARAAVAEAAAERVGRVRRAPDAAAMIAQTLRRATGAAEALLQRAMRPGEAASAAAAAAERRSLGLGLGASLGRTAHAHARHASRFYPAAARGIRLHTSVSGVLSSIVANEGAAALFRGLAPRLVTNGPASAATLVAFEWVKRMSMLPPPPAPPPGPHGPRTTLTAHEEGD